MEPMNELINYHSDWHKLKRSVAWISKVKETERRKELSRTISQTEKDPDKQKLKLEQHMKKCKITIGKKSMTLGDLVAAESEIIQFKTSVWKRNQNTAEGQTAQTQQSAVQARSSSSR